MVTNLHNYRLPLFMLRGSERTKYYKAIILLNLNLQHVSFIQQYQDLISKQILKLKGFKRPMRS